MSNLKGKILIAEPYMGDPNFERSVILICEDTSLGSFGLVLNQPINKNLSDVIDEVYSEVPLFSGGPVEKNTLHYVHNMGLLIDDSFPLTENLFWSGDFETIKSLLNTGSLNNQNIRFFLGYSGWGPGQLKQELEEKTWIIADLDSENIFESNSSEFWRQTLKKLGGANRIKANYPIDPRLN